VSGVTRGTTWGVPYLERVRCACGACAGVAESRRGLAVGATWRKSCATCRRRIGASASGRGWPACSGS